MEGSLLQCLILALLLVIMLMNRYGAVEGAHTLPLGSSLRGNETILSQNGMFELGFFNPNGTTNWYVDIWYAKVSEKAYVWVANRESPIKNMPSFLHLSREGQLGLFDAEGASLWSPNGTNSASEAVLLDSSNFVMRSAENKSETVWESFDHPVDMWLSGMKMSRKSKLISWRNSVDPAPGIFSFEMDQLGALQFVVTWNNSVKYWETGVRDGKLFANIPDMASGRYIFSAKNTTSASGVYFTYSISASTDEHSHFGLDKAGAFRMYHPIEDKGWISACSEPSDQCDVYGVCGVYGISNSNNIQFCSCPQGFQPRDEQAWGSQEWWTGGCVRRSPLNCGVKNSGADQLIDLKNVWLPDDHNYQNRSFAATWNDCEKACLSTCSCTVVTYMSNICKIWRGDLLNMRNGPPRNDSDVFVRVVASEFRNPSSFKGRRSKIAAVVGVIVACAIVFAILAWLLWGRCRMRSKQGCTQAFASSLALRFTVASRCTHPEANEVDAPPSIRMFTYKELQISTRCFTHKLGSGAFGSVFRGTLPDSTIVAVKKLQGKRQGEKQFRAEINTVGNINHMNVVRLRGFCAERSRRLRVYDYMPNGSLDTFLFSKKSKNEKKYRNGKSGLR